MYGFGSENPFSAFVGTKKALDTMRSDKMQNALKQLELQYKPKQYMDEETARTIANQTGQTNLNYLAPYLSARNQGANLGNQGQSLQNALLQIENQYAPQQYQGRNALLNEQIASAKFENQLAPQEFELRKKQLEQQQGRFGQQYQVMRLIQSLPPAAKAAFLAQNADLVNQLGVSGLNQAATESGVSGMPGQEQQLQQGQGQIPGQSPIVPQPNLQAEQLRNALQLEANNAVTTPGTRAQIEGGQQLLTFFDSPLYKDQLNSAAKYAGAAGKGKSALDAFKNSNQEDYINAQNFQHTTMPLIGNRIKQLDSMSSDIEGRKELHKLYGQAFEDFTGNPERFKKTFATLEDTLRTMEGAVSKSGQKIFKQEEHKAESSNNIGGYGMDEIQDYAKRNNMTPDQVVQMIKERSQ